MDTTSFFVSPRLLLTVYLVFSPNPFISVSSRPLFGFFISLFHVGDIPPVSGEQGSGHLLEAVHTLVNPVLWTPDVRACGVRSSMISLEICLENLQIFRGRAGRSADTLSTSATPTVPSVRVSHTPYLQRRSSGIFWGENLVPCLMRHGRPCQMSQLPKKTKKPLLWALPGICGSWYLSVLSISGVLGGEPCHFSSCHVGSHLWSPHQLLKLHLSHRAFPQDWTSVGDCAK